MSEEKLAKVHALVSKRYITVERSSASILESGIYQIEKLDGKPSCLKII